MLSIHHTVAHPLPPHRETSPIPVSHSRLVKNLLTLPPDLKDKILGRPFSFLPRKTMVQDIFTRQAENQPDSLEEAVNIHLLTKHTGNPPAENNVFLKQSLLKRHTPLFDALLKHSADPDLPALIEIAAMAQDHPAFQKLLTKINHPLPEFALRWVAECGQPNHLNQLFQKIPSGLTPERERELMTLAERQEEKIEQYRTLPAHQKEANLLTACTQNEDSVRQEVFALVQVGANPNVANPVGQTPLHWACGHGQVEVVRALIQAGANFDDANLLGFTPLMLAAEHGQTAVVKALIQAEANINAVDHTGAIALTHATTAGHEEIRAALMAQGESLP